MKHYIVVVYNLRMYMKEDNPGQKKITDRIFVIWLTALVCATQVWYNQRRDLLETLGKFDQLQVKVH
mgnify:CR=1 FL=1